MEQVVLLSFQLVFVDTEVDLAVELQVLHQDEYLDLEVQLFHDGHCMAEEVEEESRS